MELLIVGGGLAAQRCIETLRAAGDDRPVTVVCDEPVRPYDRPPLSKEGLLGPLDPSFRSDEWYREHGVEMRLGAAAAALDPARRRVELADGEPLRYDALLIATGARARALPVCRAPRCSGARSTANGCAPPCCGADRWPWSAPG